MGKVTAGQMIDRVDAMVPNVYSREEKLRWLREAERSVVDIETLQHTNQQLISTLDEVLNIQREGAQKRRAAEAELGRIEGELKQKLLELRN